MSSVIGFKSPALEESVSEGMVSIVFIKGNQVVCSICDFPWRTGYFLDLGHFDDGRSFMRICPENDTLTILQDMDSCFVLKFMGEGFEGEVGQISGTSALVSIDEGFPIRNSGDQVCIYLTEEIRKEIKVGDHVKVRYDGMVLETSPLQLAGQMEVEILQQETNLLNAGRQSAGIKENNHWICLVSDRSVCNRTGTTTGGMDYDQS